jgi:tripartite-type tricarboxylate transporter receptor subunit TctC
MTQAAVPQAIRDKISKDWADALKTPEVQNKLKSQFMIGVSDTPAQMDKIVASETAQLTETFKAAGITPSN